MSSADFSSELLLGGGRAPRAAPGLRLPQPDAGSLESRPGGTSAAFPPAETLRGALTTLPPAVGPMCIPEALRFWRWGRALS